MEYCKLKSGFRQDSKDIAQRHRGILNTNKTNKEENQEFTTEFCCPSDSLEYHTELHGGKKEEEDQEFSHEQDEQETVTFPLFQMVFAPHGYKTHDRAYNGDQEYTAKYLKCVYHCLILLPRLIFGFSSFYLFCYQRNPYYKSNYNRADSNCQQKVLRYFPA